MANIKITPIQETDIAAVGRFLHENLNRQFSAETWSASLLHRWSETRPNFGMQLRDDDRLVGVFLALYSDQVIDGRVERFCNPHSWCVLPDYRRHSISLLLPLIKQPGYHFVMQTPNPTVAKVFLGLKFRNLDDRALLFPNLPLRPILPAGAFAESRRDRIAELLGETDRRDFEAHKQFPWIEFVAFGVPGDACLIAFKPTRWKRIPCANLIHISDPGAFDRHATMLKRHLLFARGMPLARVESRWLSDRPRLGLPRTRTQPKLFLSATLTDRQIRDFYSELVALDL